MRRVLFPFAVLLVLLLLGSDSPKEYDDTTENVSIEGTWQIVSAGRGLQQTTVADRCIGIWQHGKWSYTQAKGYSTGGRYKIDSHRTPAALDEVQTTGQGWQIERRFIYRIEGETLHTAFNPNNPLNRPRSFDEDGVYIVTWKRVK